LEGLGGTRSTPPVTVTNVDAATYAVQVDNKPVNERYRFTVDRKTDLPKTMDVEKSEADGWTLVGKGTIEFNRQLSADLFQPNFPADAKVVDADAYKKNLSTEFKKTVATVRMPHGQPLVIHDIQANTQGNIFLVYSGPELGFQQWAELRDERGIAYVKIDKYNQGNFPDQDLDMGHGSPVKLQWWISTEASPTFAPHKFTYVLKSQKRTPVGHRGGFTPGAIREVGRTAFSVDHPSTTGVPAYIPIVDNHSLMMPQDDSEAQIAIASEMCRYLQHRWVDRSGKPLDDSNPGGGFTTFSGRETGNRREVAALKAAMDYAHREIELENERVKTHGQGSVPYQGYCDAFQISTLLGRNDEANRYLEDIRKFAPQAIKDELRWREFETQIGNIPAKP